MTYTSETTTIPTVPGEEREPFAPSSPANRPSPLDNISAEKPRTHPVAYGAMALAALALILSVFALSRDTGDDYKEVRVNGQACVIHMSGDSDVLFCATGPVPTNS